MHDNIYGWISDAIGVGKCGFALMAGTAFALAIGFAVGVPETNGPAPNPGETGPAAKGCASVLNTTGNDKNDQHALGNREAKTRTFVNADMVRVVECQESGISIGS